MTSFVGRRLYSPSGVSDGVEERLEGIGVGQDLIGGGGGSAIIWPRHVPSAQTAAAEAADRG